jgi:BirA family transcriptional regulator, biotin operon repressor / biotin---[acetyl-CoA-carboxylase] ligase
MQSELNVARILADSFVARVEHYAALPSTQMRAREAAANPFETLPLLVLADEQTAGRGREGNSWWTGLGNLAFSLLIDPSEFGCPRRAVPSMSLAVSVAIIEAILPWTAGHRVGLHWPNDVFAAGKKLAGVLVEVLPDGRHILGVGLNTNSRVATAPADLQAILTTLLDLTGQRQEHTDLLLALLSHLDACLRQLGADPDVIGARFNELCLQNDQTLTLFQGERAIVGRCLGIAPDGGLILQTTGGPQAFHSGTLQPPKTRRPNDANLG